MAPSLVVAVVLSAIVALLLVYRYDLYNREPWYMLALAVVSGAAAMRLVDEVELVALGLVDSPAAQAAVAASHEEIARLAVVAAIAIFFPRQFDDPMDGIVYGSIVGLGMAIEESFSLGVALPNEIVRLLGHLVMGGIAGFGVGLFRMKLRGYGRALGCSFAAAFFLHFAWDWLALAAPVRGGAFLAVAILLSGIVVYGLLVVSGSRLSREAFEPKIVRSLWGWPFKG